MARGTSETSSESLSGLIEGARRSPEYATDLVALAFTEALAERMDELGMKRSELADRMRVSRPMVTKLLRGTGNLTLQTMTNAARAVGCDLQLSLVPAGADPAVHLSTRRESARSRGPASARKSAARVGRSGSE